MTRLLITVAASLTLLACPAPAGPPDAAADAGQAGDAGIDGGRQLRDAGPPDAGFVSVPIDAWCQSRALAQCWRGMRCGRVDQAVLATCVASWLSACDPVALSRGVREGRISYDPLAAAACLNAFNAGSCEATPASCNTLFVGHQPPDAGCLIDQDCDGTAGYCDLYDDRCPHRCRAWARVGQRCDFYQQCLPGAAACEDDADGGPDQHCVPQRDAGDDCIASGSCGVGLYCNQKKCIAQHAGPGEPCGVSNGFPYCDAEFFCRQATTSASAGTCQKRAGLGGTCQGSGSCLPSLRCSSAIGTGVCQTRAATGGLCSGYGECLDGLFCLGPAAACTALPGDGGDCSFDPTGSSYQCAPGSFCQADFIAPRFTYTCHAQRALGEDCPYDSACSSNACQYGTLPDAGYGGRCVPRCAQRADGGL